MKKMTDKPGLGGQLAMQAKRLPLCIVCPVLLAPIAYGAELPELSAGFLAGAPVALLNRALSRRGLRLADKLPGLGGLNAAMKWSMLRMAVTVGAFLAAMPFGPYVLAGVFVTLACEMGAYISLLYRSAGVRTR